jgi:hypothetical protein
MMAKIFFVKSWRKKTVKYLASAALQSKLIAKLNYESSA